MQGDDQDQEDLARLAVCGAEDGVHVAEQEGDRHAQADTDKHVVEDLDLRPADQGHGDPDQVGVSIEGPALEQVGALGTEVFQGAEEEDGDDEGVAVDETSGACIYPVSLAYLFQDRVRMMTQVDRGQGRGSEGQRGTYRLAA